MDWLADPNAWIAFATLVALEIVLGIDNIIFISILASKLEKNDQPRARRLGLLGAFVMRIALLFSIAWLVRLTKPLFNVFGTDFTGRGLLLLRRVGQRPLRACAAMVYQSSRPRPSRGDP